MFLKPYELVKSRIGISDDETYDEQRAIVRIQRI